MRNTKLLMLLLLVVVFFTSQIVTAQTNTWPKSLLWRISGNGLTKPSYLYGTMHVQDKRVFYFSDSLYQFLEQADGYALEIDFQEYIDSMMQLSFQEAEMNYLNDDYDRVNKSGEKKKIIDSLLSHIKTIGDKKSQKKLRDLRKRELQKIIGNKSMPVIMDLYLYGIAKKHGKWLGAVEDVQDQLFLADEMGRSLEGREFLESEKTLRNVLEDMITIYLQQDLHLLDKFVQKGDKDSFLLKGFINRNKKMARRMDSLSQIRSMFFAVGAAHLPGDSGVITMLRDKGYFVEPVFSEKKIDPDKYAKTLKALPWEKFEDENSLYKIEMPGKPYDLNFLGEMMKMKVYVDISTMTFYLTGYTIGQKDFSKPEGLMKDMAENMGRGTRPQNIKKLKKGGIEGVECVISNSNMTYKVQVWQTNNTLFITMAGVYGGVAALNEDVDRFLQSLIINSNKKEKLEYANWIRFELKEKAVAVKMPGQPKRNNVFEKSAEGSNWTFAVYDYMDVHSGIYYMLQVRDLTPGYFLDGDSNYFKLLENHFESLVEEISTNEQTFFMGFPAFRFDGIAKEGGVYYKSLSVNRGNRVYFLMAIGTKSDSLNPDNDEFLNSLTLLDYLPQVPVKQISPDHSFHTIASYPFELKAQDTTDLITSMDASINYVSFNPNEAISYEVMKDKMSSYFWVANDSMLHQKFTDRIKNYTDSLIHFRKTINGTLPGIESVYQMEGNNNLKIARQFMNGDTLYTLLSFIPSQYADEERHKKFFEEFRVTSEESMQSVFENKAEKLLRDLQSSDSTEFSDACDAISKAPFTKADLPLLHSALIAKYPADTINYYSVYDRLITAMEKLADNSTIGFIKLNYSSLTEDKETIKYHLLELLARMKTSESYMAMKNLLISDAPKAYLQKGLSYQISDSLELCQLLYPEILRLSNYEFLWPDIVSYSQKMLDSGRINMDIIKPYKNTFLGIADTVLKKLKKEPESYRYGLVMLLKIIGRFNDIETNSMLHQYLETENLYIKQEVILCLIKNNQKVDPRHIEKIAENNSYRADLYNALKEIGRENLFPAKYYTQRYFAESELFSYASYDYEPTSTEFIGERTQKYGDKQQRFFLFKVVYDFEEEEPEIYLGVAGPYSMNQKDVTTSGDATGLYYDEPFQQKKINKQFEAFLKSTEK